MLAIEAVMIRSGDLAASRPQPRCWARARDGYPNNLPESRRERGLELLGDMNVSH